MPNPHNFSALCFYSQGGVVLSTHMPCRRVITVMEIKIKSRKILKIFNNESKISFLCESFNNKVNSWNFSQSKTIALALLGGEGAVYPPLLLKELTVYASDRGKLSVSFKSAAVFWTGIFSTAGSFQRWYLSVNSNSWFIAMNSWSFIDLKSNGLDGQVQWLFIFHTYLEW